MQLPTGERRSTWRMTVTYRDSDTTHDIVCHLDCHYWELWYKMYVFSRFLLKRKYQRKEYLQ